MRASSDPVALGHPEFRASDAEREDAVGQLRERFAEGRLSQETFLYRMDAALRAKFPSELSGLFSDLPREERRRPRQLIRDQLARLRLSSPWRAEPPGSDAPQTLLRRRAPAGSPPPGWPMPPRPLILPRQADRLLSIGRASSCDFTVPDISVSRWHAKLQRQGGLWILTDLESTNGTRLNGWRITSSVPVKPGDQVTFGNIAFVLADDGPPVADPPVE
jgi:hypothetical protein